jgi:hypothetical protein
VVDDWSILMTCEATGLGLTSSVVLTAAEIPTDVSKNLARQNNISPTNYTV